MSNVLSDTSADAPTDITAPIVLSDDEAELVAAEAAAAARVLDPERGEAATGLAEAARAGVVEPEHFAILAELTTASIQGGRARRLYRAEGEKLLNAVLNRTPEGRRSQADLDAVNAALKALAGRRIESVRVARRAPGQLVVRVKSEELTMALDVSHGGVAIESVTL